MKNPEFTKNTLILACALSLAITGCKKEKQEIIPTKHSEITPITVQVRERVKEATTPPPIQASAPEKPKETRSVKFPNGNKLPLVEWGEPKHYKGCGELSFQKDFGDIQKSCYFYNPRQNQVHLVRIEGNEMTHLSDHFQAWEFAIIDPVDVKAGDIAPEYYYEHEIPDALAEEGKRTVSLYKVARIDPEFVRLIEAIRKEYGYPISPDEAYRSYVHNHNTGAARKSFHLSGSAMDINLDRTLAFLQAKCNGEGQPSKAECSLETQTALRDHIARIAGRVMNQTRGGGGIGKGPTILHLDDDTRMRRWKYHR